MKSSAIVVALAILASGCSDEPEGDTSETPAPPTQAVPTVAQPLNATPFLARPCDLVGQQALGQFGEVQPGTPDVDSDMAKNLTGPTCNWRAVGDGPEFFVVVETVHQAKAQAHLKGIGGIYAEKDNPRFVEFKPLEVPGHPGYPAVIARSQADVDGGKCSVRVGIANDLVFGVELTNEADPGAACTGSTQVAAAVLDTLKKGA